MDSNSIFMDAGSGIGTMQFVAILVAGVKEAKGIEFFENRVSCAVKIKSILAQQGADVEGVSFQQKNLKELDEFVCTHLFAYDLVFNGDLLDSIFTTLRKSPSVKVFVSTLNPSTMREFAGDLAWELVCPISNVPQQGCNAKTTFYIYQINKLGNMTQVILLQKLVF
jgi:hypothetical protein